MATRDDTLAALEAVEHHALKVAVAIGELNQFITSQRLPLARLDFKPAMDLANYASDTRYAIKEKARR